MQTPEPSALLTVVTPEEWGPSLPLVEGEGEFRVMVGPLTNASERSMHYIRLSENARTVSLRHPGEAVYYVVSGSLEVEDLDAGSSHPLVAGSMIHVEPGTSYRLHAIGDSVVMGGPCPVDPEVYAVAAQRQLEAASEGGHS
jgi:quercetin dioxygenase-like cupin family protein